MPATTPSDPTDRAAAATGLTDDATTRTTRSTPTTTAEADDVPGSRPADASGRGHGVPSTDDLIAEYEEEQPARRLPRGLDRFVFVWCLLVALFVVLQVFHPLAQGSHFYLVLFLGFTLPLVFLTYRGRPLITRGTGRPRAHDPHEPDRPGVLDWALAALALLVTLYPVLPLPEGPFGGGGFSAFLSRQGSLLPLDVVAGVLLLVLVLEAADRTTGWVLPTAALLFFAYAWFGGWLPLEWDVAHQGLDLGQIVNSLYNEASGFFGVPLDVAATYIVLFTIYGAVLRLTGAGSFFVEFSLSLFRRSGAAPGRTVATSGFLLGTVSGSGTATAVTLGSFAWPILQRAGYPREAAGGMLAASGIGAILSPPTMGAAAFIIAEYLNVPYIQVLTWAIVPTLLYYLGIFLAVEMDARRFGVSQVDVRVPAALTLLRRFGYHFVSLGVIVLFLALDIPPFKAVVYATLTALAFGLLEVLFTGHLPGSSLDRDVDSDVALAADEGPRGGLVAFGYTIARALSEGVRTALPVIAVCAAAGVITSSIAKTGLAQVLSEFLVAVADAVAPNHATFLVLSAVFSALAILVLGLAVPVTASFILSWVVIGPALISLGVAPPAVAMFIFYYAVLSEVSPPTVLAAVASAAITGGKVIDTMWQACKYTLPAFLAPIAFVVTPAGAHLLLTGDPGPILLAVFISMLAVASLAAATGGWIRGPVLAHERVGFLLAAVLLLYLQPLSVGLGLALLALSFTLHWFRTRKVTR